MPSRTSVAASRTLLASSSRSPLKKSAHQQLLNLSHLACRDDVSRCPFLYSQSSYSSLYDHDHKFGQTNRFIDLNEVPGPNHYRCQEAMGQQIKSSCETAPSICIPSKNSESWSKVFVSKEQSEASGRSRYTPGPGTYESPDGISVSLKTKLGISFGTSERPKPGFTTPSPGPIYDVRHNFDVPTTGFSKGDRFASSGHSGDSTGPFGSSAPLPGALDPNRLAKSFAAGRDAWEKVVFPGCEKVFRGRACDVVGQYKPYEIRLARKEAFSKAVRKGLNAYEEKAPGPGQYSVIGRTNESVRTKPCHSFGKPPEKARLNWGRQGRETATWARLGMSRNIRAGSSMPDLGGETV